MTIRTYRAKTIADALSQVKQDLGRDAVILHTRTFRTGGWFGFRRTTITEITATTQATLVGNTAKRAALDRAVSAGSAPNDPRSPGDPAPNPAAASAVAAYRRASSASPAPAPPPTGSAPSTGQATAAPSSRPSPAPSAKDEQPPSPLMPLEAMTSSTPLKQVAQMIVAASGRSSVEEELGAIKRMVGQVLRSSRSVQHHSMPDALFQCYLKLLESEVAAEIADAVVGAVRDELSAAELADVSVVHQSVLRRLAGYIPVCDQALRVNRAPDGRPLTIALVGPTGVGKTTTIAKLAATYKLRQGRRVGLITCDTYRIAAVEQLRTYANIIGLPLKVVLTPTEMKTACAQLAECEVILIDTAGRSPRDEGRINELRSFTEAARPHQTHLVLSSSAGEASLSDAAARFGAVGCDRVIFTKLDEAVNFGVLLNIVRRLDARLSFITTGQEVPDHIEPGNADRLARLMLSGEAAR